MLCKGKLAQTAFPATPKSGATCQSIRVPDNVGEPREGKCEHQRPPAATVNNGNRSARRKLPLSETMDSNRSTSNGCRQAAADSSSTTLHATTRRGQRHICALPLPVVGIAASVTLGRGRTLQSAGRGIPPRKRPAAHFQCHAENSGWEACQPEIALPPAPYRCPGTDCVTSTRN